MNLDADNPLAVELHQERAAAYFGACRKMVDALEALRGFDQNPASQSPAGDSADRRQELLEQAAERVYFVVIQREAMKLSNDPAFFERYEVPEEVRRRLGPRRRNRPEPAG